MEGPIGKLGRIGPGLYRGAQPGSDDLRYLQSIGIRTIVNLREGHSERTEAEALGLSVIEIPMHAGLDVPPPTPDQVDAFLRTVLDPSKQPVFVHCLRGADRTGAMIAIYRIEVDGWTNEQAIEEMQAYGFNDLYQGLLAFVRQYKPRGK